MKGFNFVNRLFSLFRPKTKAKTFEFPLNLSGWDVPDSKGKHSKGYGKAMLKRIEKRRARNQMARKSRRINRLRAA